MDCVDWCSVCFWCDICSKDKAIACNDLSLYSTFCNQISFNQCVLRMENLLHLAKRLKKVRSSVR